MGRPASTRIKVPPWWVFTTLAVLLVGLVLTSLRLPREEPAPAASRAAPLGLELNLRPAAPAAGVGWREEMALLDPTPLFLPTPWNSGGAARLVSSPRESGLMLEDFGPWWVFPARRATVSFLMPVEVPASPMAAVASGREARAGRALALMRADLPARPLGARAGWIEVTDTGSGAVRFAGPLRLASDSSPQGDLWRTVDFLVAINRHGWVSQPTPLNSSGSEAMDSLLPTALARDPRLSASLAPGRYRITVGP